MPKTLVFSMIAAALSFSESSVSTNFNILTAWRAWDETSSRGMGVGRVSIALALGVLSVAWRLKLTPVSTLVSDAMSG